MNTRPDPHATARRRIQAGLDGRLATAERLELDDHLRACAACRRYAAEMKALEPALAHALHARWGAARPKPLTAAGLRRRGARRPDRFGGLAALGAVAVLALALAFTLQVQLQPRVPGGAQSEGIMTTPPPMMFTTSVRFGEAMALEGYSLIPGEGGVTVKLLWRALGTPPADYAVGVFVMPDGAQSAIPAQSDSAPAAGTRPTSGWQPGEYILDEHDLALSPETNVAQLVLWVNVYDPQTGERLASEPAGSGPFNAVPIGAFNAPSGPPITHTPPPYPTNWTPDPCTAGPCTPTPTAACGPNCPATPPAVTYTVQEGDTLQGIADSYGVTVADLMEVNGITDPASLAVGQTLTIPLDRRGSPTPCQVGCEPQDPGTDATAAWAATLGWTPTPPGFEASPTPCQAGCEASGSAGESMLATPTPTPCQVGCPAVTPTPPPTIDHSATPPLLAPSETPSA